MRHLIGRHGPLHWLFEASLLVKGIFAAFEALAGAILLWTSHDALMSLVEWLTRNELIEDRHAPLASWLAGLAARFDAPSQHFYAIYLLSHGLAKLAVIALLARKVAFAYPLAIAVFGGFVIYQMHRWSLTGSPMMLALSGFDLLVVWLIWREWRAGPAARMPAELRRGS